MSMVCPDCDTVYETAHACLGGSASTDCTVINTVTIPANEYAGLLSRVAHFEQGLNALCDKYPGNGGYIMKEVRKLLSCFPSQRHGVK